MSTSRDWLDANRANWNDRADIHIDDETGFYGIDRLLAGDIVLTAIERGELPDLAGLRVAHLQCHIGTDTISLKRLGAAEVVGLDFSPRAIAHARDLAARCGEDVRFVEANVYDAPTVLGGDFDLVFTSWGTLGWHNDIPAWATAVAGCLKPGGRLYFADGHPAAMMFDTDLGDFALRFDYVTPVDAPTALEAAETYTGSKRRLEHARIFEWGHGIGRILNAVIGAGLRLDFVNEHDAVPWAIFRFAVRGEDGLFRTDDERVKFPLSWSFAATKT